MKRVVIYTTIGAVLIVLGVFTTSVVSAEDSVNTVRLPMAEELAEKLDLDQEVVDAAMEEIHEERRTERRAERAESILKAIEDGKLTERQAQILDAMEDLRPEEGYGFQGQMRDLSEEEREEMRAERQASMLEQLRKVLYVTDEEMDELHELMQDLGINGGGMGRGGRGMHANS